ncbi:MAG: 3-hydroxyacyl-ACP dehydratase FabZ [Syntrophobacterales bacterium]|nr:MAG: 3-hydroxyacyl-ACP dehydratase FabZ [Syntrophobacterales bacterium]
MIQINEIMEILPHGYPFLLVDRIVELEKGKRIVGIKNVTINEPFFQGHFPGQPIMPGVLIVEAMAQTAGLLASQSIPRASRKNAIYFMAIDKVRFRRPIYPGDQIRMEMVISKQRKSVWGFAGKAYVDGQLAVEAEMMAMLGGKG